MARKASEETIRQAAQIGAKAVVFHLGRAGPHGVTHKLENALQPGSLFLRPALRRNQG